MEFINNYKIKFKEFGEIDIGTVFYESEEYFMKISMIDDGYGKYNCVHLKDGCLDYYSPSETVQIFNNVKLVVS